MAAVLRVIYGGVEPRVAIASAPELPAQNSPDRIPQSSGRFSTAQVLAAALISVSVHAGLIAWGLNLNRQAGEEARAEGGSEEMQVMEGVSVVLLDSLASDASDGDAALPEATAVADAPPVDAVAETEITTAAALPEAAPVEDFAPTEAMADTVAVVEDARVAAVEMDARPVVPDRIAVPASTAEAAMTRYDATAVTATTAVAAIDARAAALVDDTVTNAASDVSAGAVIPDAPVGRVADAVPVAGAASEQAAVADDQAAPVTEDDAIAAVVEDASVAVAEDASAAVDDTVVAAVDVASDPPMPRMRPEVVPPPPGAAPPKPAKPAAPPAPAQPRAKPAAPPPAPAARSERREASVAETAAEGPRAGNAGAGGASSSERGKADLSSYQSRLAARLRRFRTYPAEAARQNLTGTAVVTFTVNAGGNVTRASLAKSSGAPILDQAALAMVKRASPFPPIPAGLDSSITVSVPIRYDAR